MTQYAPDTRFAQGPNGYWIPVSSGGRPLSDFVEVMNPNGQGAQFIPREQLPADFQPGMSLLQNPNGTFRAVPFTAPQIPYWFHDYSTGAYPGTNPGPGGLSQPPTQQPPGGLLDPGANPGGALPGGLPPSGPNTGTAPPPQGNNSGGGLPVGGPGGGPVGQPGNNGVPVSMPNTNGPVSLPPMGAGTARDEIERLRLAGLLDNLHLNNPDGVRGPDFGNGPNQPMTHDPGQAALYEYLQNNYFGTWDPRQTRGGSNPYYNAPTSGPAGLLPPAQGPVIVGPNGMPMGLL